jgi:hypothetical protein
VLVRSEMARVVSRPWWRMLVGGVDGRKTSNPSGSGSLGVGRNPCRSSDTDVVALEGVIIPS